jgi:hypothetical protein
LVINFFPAGQDRLVRAGWPTPYRPADALMHMKNKQSKSIVSMFFYAPLLVLHRAHVSCECPLRKVETGFDYIL